MSVLKIQDSFNFILQPYRETLTMKSSALLRKEIRYLSEQYGEYVRLFKIKGEFEAVFSKEPGYLLGEMIWHYFHHIDDMIYCEVLNANEIILVVVRDGKIYLDAKLTLALFQEELANLLTDSKNRYQVFYYGDIPEYLFAQPAIKSVNQSKEAVCAVIQPDKQYYILSVEDALDEFGLELHIKRHFSLILLTIISIVILGLIWVWISRPEKPAAVQVNPYQQFELALQTPNPEEQIKTVINKIEKVNEIRGWYAGAVTYNGETVQMPLHSLGGTATDLIMRSQALQMEITFSSEGAILHFPTHLTPRGTPDHIAKSDQIVAIIIDRMMKVLPGKSVQINNTQSNTVFNQTSLTISFKNVSSSILELMGKNLSDLPVVLTSFTASLANGLYTGNIQLNVVGN
jgi:hypothetical protein